MLPDPRFENMFEGTFKRRKAMKRLSHFSYASHHLTYPDFFHLHGRNLFAPQPHIRYVVPTHIPSMYEVILYLVTLP